MRIKFDRYPNEKRKYGKAFEKLEENAIKKYGNVCEICKCTYPNWIPVLHHRDFNPGNNHLSNIMLICWPCHSAIHSNFPNWRWLSDNEIEQIIKKGSEILKRPFKRRMLRTKIESLSKERNNAYLSLQNQKEIINTLLSDLLSRYGEAVVELISKYFPKFIYTKRQERETDKKLENGGW